MKKRGSHVGIVISFVVFIVFIVFLYSIMEPTLNFNKDKQIILDHLKTELIKKISGELTTYSFKINNSDDIIPSDSECFKINSSLSDISGVGSVIINESGVVGSGIDNDGLLSINESNPKNKFYRTYYSKEFSNNIAGLSDCYEINPVNYTIGSLRTGNSVFESKILLLIKKYNADYNSLKTELGIPDGSDFSFSFIDKENKEIKTIDKNLSVNIYAEKLNLDYMDNNASINKGYINIKVW